MMTEFMKWPVESIFDRSFSSTWIERGSFFSPYTTAGTRPSRRSAREAPLPARSRALAGSVSCSLILRSPIENPRHASRDDHGRGKRAPSGGAAEKQVGEGSVDPLRRDSALRQLNQQAVFSCKVAGPDRDEHGAWRLQPRPDPVSPSRVPLGEHHPVCVG